MADSDALGTDATPGDNLINDGAEYDLADANDVFFAKRDDENDPVPVKQKVPGKEAAVRVVPPTEGYYNKYLDPVPADDNELVAEMLNKGFPDLDVDEEDVENGLLIYSLETAVELLKRAGGHDIYSALQEQREDQNMKQIQTMMKAMGVSEGDDMGPAEFLNALNDMDMEDMEEAAEENAPEEGEFVAGPARPNGDE